MRVFGRIGVGCRVIVLLAAACFTGSLATAQAVSQAAPATDRLAALEKSSAAQAAAIAAAQTSGDNAWMLTSSALVLMMSGPGLALFYGGLVRRKNVLGTMMQTFAMMAVITVLWALLTYSLAFGEGSAFIGGLHNVFLHGVGLDPDPKYAATIPLQTYMVFQLMFAIITPALITGAFAERMKFSAMLVFMVLWAILVYSPMAHMVWGKGGLLNAALGGRFPLPRFCRRHRRACDVGRVRAGDGAVYLGKRLGYPKESMAPHSVVLSFIGACLLAVGRVVWVQRRLSFKCGHLGDIGFYCHTFWRSRCGGRLERSGISAQPSLHGSRRNFGCGGWAGGNHSGLRLCHPDVRFVDRPHRRDLLLPDGGEGQGGLWL